MGAHYLPTDVYLLQTLLVFHPTHIKNYTKPILKLVAITKHTQQQQEQQRQ